MRKLLAVLLLAAAPCFAGARTDFSFNAAARNISAVVPAPAVVYSSAPPAQDSGPRLTVFYRAFEIQGSTAFIAATESALELLNGSAAFTEVAPYLSVIEQAERSGMVAWTERPVFQVGNATWRHSAHWYAGAIAHDANHSRLYQVNSSTSGQPPPDEAWTGAEAESKCLALQSKVLAEIKADKYMIDYVDEQIAEPTHHLIPYEDRDW